MGIKLNKNTWWYFLVATLSILGCFNNQILSDFLPLISVIQLSTRVLVFAACLFYSILVNRSFSRPFIIYSSLIMVFLLSGLFNSSNIVSLFGNLSYSLTIAMVLEAFRKDQRALLTIMRIWKWIIVLLLIIDIITELAFPSGMYESRAYTLNWFLGYKSERAVYTFPLIIMTSFISVKTKGHITLESYGIFAIVMLNSILSKGTVMTFTMLVLITLIVISDLLSRTKMQRLKKALRFIIDYRIIIPVYSIFTIALLFSENNFLVKFISDLFNKDNGISSRDVIWEKLLHLLDSKMVLGTGFMSRNQYIGISGFPGGSNAHNAILTLLVNGGLIAIAIYIVLHVITIHKNKGTASTPLILAIYANLLFGTVSSIMVLSTFSMLPFFILEGEKKQHSPKKGCVKHRP